MDNAHLGGTDYLNIELKTQNLPPRRFQGVEHMLSALEMLGIDNARIELEGGHELPIIDGSALGWAIDVQAVSDHWKLMPSASLILHARHQRLRAQTTHRRCAWRHARS